jgi:hypothetical protein
MCLRSEWKVPDRVPLMLQARSKEDAEEGEITTEDAKARKVQELKAAAAELKVPDQIRLSVSSVCCAVLEKLKEWI